MNRETQHVNHEEYYFLTQKVARLRSKSLFRKNMIISFCMIFFAKNVVCNEVHENQRFQEKNKKLSKLQMVMHFWV